MKNVDYQKLSEQYAGFLVAIGGVSITVLTLVLTFSNSTKLGKGNLGAYLVLALVVATVCCFIGAQMLAETAAFISYSKENPAEVESEQVKPAQAEELDDAAPESPIRGEEIPSGKRLFVLASINIFLAVVLLLFALILLPAAFEISNADAIQSISLAIFLIVLLAALFWLLFGGRYRIDISGSLRPFWLPPLIVAIFCSLLFYYWSLASQEVLLWLTFIPAAASAVGSLCWFTFVFRDAEVKGSTVWKRDVWFFSSTIAASYGILVTAALRTILYG